MAQILVTKPGVLSAQDRETLLEAGVVTIEADNPSDVRLIDASGAELAAGDMLFAAMKAIASDKYTANVAQKLPAIMLDLMRQRRADAEEPTP